MGHLPPDTRGAAAVLRAALFAARVHAQHRRKGGSAEPDVNHVLEVAQILAEHGAPPEAVLASLLHDTVEDSDQDPDPITHDRLVVEFGEPVPRVVASRGATCRPTPPTLRGSPRSQSNRPGRR